MENYLLNISSDSIESVKNELLEYGKENHKYHNFEDENELHFSLFNEDYYLIGYYKTAQWLKKHNIEQLDAVSFVQGYERDNFGEDSVGIYDNTETLVNMLVYIIGEEIVNGLFTDISKLKEKSRIDSIAKEWVGRGFITNLFKTNCNTCRL
tara:strand:- start:377 stop:832 length:456 start_codon:yes stop_codon:yes gene_type:complete